MSTASTLLPPKKSHTCKKICFMLLGSGQQFKMLGLTPVRVIQTEGEEEAQVARRCLCGTGSTYARIRAAVPQLHGKVDQSRRICSAAPGGKLSLRAADVVACVRCSGENGLGSCVHGWEPQHRGRLLVVRMSQSGEGLVFHSWPAWPTREPLK